MFAVFRPHLVVHLAVLLDGLLLRTELGSRNSLGVRLGERRALELNRRRLLLRLLDRLVDRHVVFREGVLRSDFVADVELLELLDLLFAGGTESLLVRLLLISFLDVLDGAFLLRVRRSGRVLLFGLSEVANGFEPSTPVLEGIAQAALLLERRRILRSLRLRRWVCRGVCCGALLGRTGAGGGGSSRRGGFCIVLHGSLALIAAVLVGRGLRRRLGKALSTRLSRVVRRSRYVLLCGRSVLLTLAAGLALVGATERLVDGFGVDLGVVFLVRLRLCLGVGRERVFVLLRILVLRVAKLFQLVRPLVVLAFASFCETDRET